MRALITLVLALALLAAGAAVGAGWWWMGQPLGLAEERVEYTVQPGSSARTVADGWVGAGVHASPWLLYQYFRLSGQARQIRAGSYLAEEGITPRGLLQKMVLGQEQLAAVRFVEGWTFRELRAELARTPTLKHDSAGLGAAELMAAIGAPGIAPEGRFFPDTYAHARGSSELQLLRRAYQAMQERLATAWRGRLDGLPLESPEQALTLASIVEKETGQAADRPTIAAVFVNRLRLGMPLQTDPTVIYGLGERFDGNLRKRDLLADTPFNTYTRKGLPPTPIALPGQASLDAVMRPAASKALYFVARGDGSSEFSHTLAEHNRAVDRYQRRRGNTP
jgi:UPF0755 protein